MQTYHTKQGMMGSSFSISPNIFVIQFFIQKSTPNLGCIFVLSSTKASEYNMSNLIQLIWLNSASWCLSIISFKINENTIIPFIYPPGNNEHNIYFLCLFFLHIVYKFKLYQICFMQDVLTKYVSYSFPVWCLSLSYMKCPEQFN